MEPLGYLHNKMDVKVLVLFILSRIDSPLRLEDLYEVAYQDDSLNYFTLVESLGELQESGHITADAEGRYYITEKGRTQGNIAACGYFTHNGYAARGAEGLCRHFR